MDEAFGMVETCGLATAVTVADIMVKTANVKLLGVERAKGQGWITVKITGDVAAVTAAVKAGIAVGETCGDYVSSKVIPRPEASIRQIFMQPDQSGDWADDFENATLAKSGDKKKDYKEKDIDVEQDSGIEEKVTTAEVIDENREVDKAENINIEENIAENEIKADRGKVIENEQVINDIKSKNKSNKNKSK